MYKMPIDKVFSTAEELVLRQIHRLLLIEV